MSIETASSSAPSIGKPSLSAGGLQPPLYNPGDTIDDVLTRLPLPLSVINQCAVLPNSKSKGHSPVFRNQFTKDKFVLSIHPDLTTYYDLFQYALHKYADQNMLGFRKLLDPLRNIYDRYQYWTYSEVAKMRTLVGSALLYLFEQFVVSESERIVTFYLPNVPEFVVLDAACQAYSLVNTCLYDSLGTSATVYILNVTKSPIIFTNKGNAEKIIAVHKEQPKDLSSLIFIVTIEDLSLTSDHQLFTAAHSAGLNVLDFKTLLKIGKDNPTPHVVPHPDDVFTISFTSGTTSLPKGVKLTHRLGLSQVTHTMLLRDIGKHGRSFEFLPMAHCYARAVVYTQLFYGFTMYFPHNPRDVTTYFDDIRVVKPTFFCTVPRVLNKIEALLKDKIELNKFLRNAINYKIGQLAQGKDPQHFWYDRFICPRFRTAVGFDEVKFILLGSAPISKKTIFFLTAVFNFRIAQGYGMTETFCSGPVTTELSNQGVGTTGYVGINIEFRLRDVPELGYAFDKNRSGEVLFRGPGVTKGYYKNQAAFEESVDEDGWFCTGDVAQLDNDYNMSVVDRIKNFFKLSQGKFVAGERVQHLYSSKLSWIDQIYVHGDARQHYLVGIVGVNLGQAEAFLKRRKIEFDFAQLNREIVNTNSTDSTNKSGSPLKSQLEQIFKRPDLKREVLLELNSSVQDSELASYEKIKNVHLAITPFSVVDDTLTPTLKIKRLNVRRKFKKELDGLYEEGELQQAVTAASAAKL